MDSQFFDFAVALSGAKQTALLCLRPRLAPLASRNSRLHACYFAKASVSISFQPIYVKFQIAERSLESATGLSIRIWYLLAALPIMPQQDDLAARHREARRDP